jgi:hypothetical protein
MLNYLPWNDLAVIECCLLEVPTLSFSTLTLRPQLGRPHPSWPQSLRLIGRHHGSFVTADVMPRREHRSISVIGMVRVLPHVNFGPCLTLAIRVGLMLTMV